MNKRISTVDIEDVKKNFTSDEWQRHQLSFIPFASVNPRRNQYALLFIVASGIHHKLGCRDKTAGFDMVYLALFVDDLIKVDRFDIKCISDKKAFLEKVPVKKFPSLHHHKENKLNMWYPEWRDHLYSRLINSLKNRKMKLLTQIN